MAKSLLLWFVLILLAIVILTAASPMEKTLGAGARIVYLHGAWVWASLLVFVAAGAIGLVGLLIRRRVAHHYSRALGRAGLFFWITYLPLSMWAMQANWNGLFLAEPRWRVAVVFAVGGLLLQLGLGFIEDPAWASLFNFLYIIALFVVLGNTDKVMHPPAPMLESNALRIQLFFGGLTVLVLLAAFQVTRWWYRFEPLKG
jgi:hypothetical protein